MQIVASAGNGASLLIAESPTADLGRVWVRRTNELYPEHSVAAIVKFGGWTEYTGDEDADEIIRTSASVPRKADPSST